jgi:extradiol dioxygenase family protein
MPAKNEDTLFVTVNDIAGHIICAHLMLMQQTEQCQNNACIDNVMREVRRLHAIVLRDAWQTATAAQDIAGMLLFSELMYLWLFRSRP